MDFFELFGLLELWVRSDPKRSARAADALWSPVGLLALSVFAGVSILYCLSFKGG
jgi:hypothetical protein